MKFFVMDSFTKSFVMFNNEKDARAGIDDYIGRNPSKVLYLAKGISEFKAAPSPEAIEIPMDNFDLPHRKE